jgi:hypothetical protein
MKFCTYCWSTTKHAAWCWRPLRVALLLLTIGCSSAHAPTEDAGLFEPDGAVTCPSSDRPIERDYACSMVDNAAQGAVDYYSCAELPPCPWSSPEVDQTLAAWCAGRVLEATGCEHLEELVAGCACDGGP